MREAEGVGRDEGVSDRSLLRRFRTGEQDAAREIYVRYAQRLIALARSQTPGNVASRFDPEDVVQSVFRTFFRRASAGFYEVPDGDVLWKLLAVLSINKVRKLTAFHRAIKRSVQTTEAMDVLAELPDDGSGNEALSLRILQMVIDELLSDLPPAHRQIIQLRIDRHSIAEITQVTQRSVRTVERVLCNFRNRLSQLIQEHVGTDIPS